MEQELLKLILVEVRETKEESKKTNERLTNIENEMVEVKGRLTNVENDMIEVKGKLINVETRLSKVEELSEFNKEAVDAMMNVINEHFKEFRNFVNKNNKEHEGYNSKLLKYSVQEDNE